MGQAPAADRTTGAVDAPREPRAVLRRSATGVRVVEHVPAGGLGVRGTRSPLIPPPGGSCRFGPPRARPFPGPPLALLRAVRIPMGD
jgi:hypothetical protein